MKVRAHMSMLFHLDKCIGCHTCSIACKNLWTDRKGAEYMWWNNVETRPGSGYPTQWEDQEHFRGGWEFQQGYGEDHKIKLRLHSKLGGLAKLYFNNDLPSLEDYYEPFTFRYGDLFTAAEGDDQPTAIPISSLTGKPLNIEPGPNWDDDLGGSPLYAKNDPNRQNLPAAVQASLDEIERVVFNYMPRICNHCLNPACVAACPYKKVYYNWSTGKSEKCILCFPRLETGQAPACAHSCVGRIRYMGVLLYDADRIPAAANVPDHELIDEFLDTILDPFDPAVIAAARAHDIDDGWIAAAQKSPPLSPVVSTLEEGLSRLDLSDTVQDFDLLDRLDAARLPIQYLANLFSVGDEEVIRRILRKMYAVRLYMRRKTGDAPVDAATLQALTRAGTTAEEAEATYKLTTLPHLYERFVLPPYHREMAVETWKDPLAHKGEAGFGAIQPPKRGD